MSQNSEKSPLNIIREDGAEGWRVLAPHANRGALVVVSDKLDLLEVAKTVARDQADLVGEWIGKRLISKPTRAQVQEWERGKTVFDCVIVQPYVLVKVDGIQGAIVG